VRCVLHRALPAEARLRSVTLVREGSHWSASVLLAREVQAPASREAEPIVGLDLGVAQPVVLATGQKYALPKATALDRAHEARLQQRLARKKRGSANRRKAAARLAAFKAHQARRRKDAMEKVTTLIAKNHGVIAMEALQVRAMTASAAGTAQEPGRNVAAKSGLNRSLLDVSPGAFRLRLGQKLARSGGALLLVPAAHTSQRCGRCGHIEAGNRASRDRFACLACGYCADADLNAARNIGERARGDWGDASKVEVAASLGLLLAQRAKPRRGFRRKSQAAGGLPASACQSLVHVSGGVLPHVYQAKAGSGARRRAQGARVTRPGSPALPGRE
jgi:putative transposase